MLCKVIDNLVPVQLTHNTLSLPASTSTIKASTWAISEEMFLYIIWMAIPKGSTDAAIVFPAQLSSLWAAHQWDSLVQLWPFLSTCWGPSPRHTTWHSPLADIYCADLCTYSHVGLCSGLCRAPFAPCTVCGHTSIFKNGLCPPCLLGISPLWWEVAWQCKARYWGRQDLELS